MTVPQNSAPNYVKEAAFGEWNVHFCLLPRKTDQGDWVWLRDTFRRYVSFPAWFVVDGMWQYSDIKTSFYEELGWKLHPTDPGLENFPLIGDEVRLDYLNYRGEQKEYDVIVLGYDFCTTPFYDGDQWFMRAVKADSAERLFALKNIHGWRRTGPTSPQADTLVYLLHKSGNKGT